MAHRDYTNAMKNFQLLNRQIRNMSNKDADMENLKNGMDMLQEDYKIMRMSQYFVYKDHKLLRRQFYNKRTVVKRGNTEHFIRKQGLL